MRGKHAYTHEQRKPCLLLHVLRYEKGVKGHLQELRGEVNKRRQIDTFSASSRRRLVNRKNPTNPIPENVRPSFAFQYHTPLHRDKRAPTIKNNVANTLKFGETFRFS